MNNFNTIRSMILICCSLLAIIPLNACGRSLKVEYDAHDPKLHGQVIHFNIPMVYMLLSEKNTKKFNNEAIKIGRVLIQKYLTTDEYSPYSKYRTEKIKDGMTFTIVSSYFVRQDFLTREFVSDYRQLVLRDENGAESTCTFKLLQHSDNTELQNE